MFSRSINFHFHNSIIAVAAATTVPVISKASSIWLLVVVVIVIIKRQRSNQSVFILCVYNKHLKNRTQFIHLYKHHL